MPGARVNARAIRRRPSTIDTPAALVSEFQAKGREVTASLDGKAYTAEFRKKVEDLVNKTRAAK